MFELLPESLRARLSEFAKSATPRMRWCERIDAPGSAAAFSSVDVGARRLLFAASDGTASPADMAGALRSLDLGRLVAEGTESIQVGVLTPPSRAAGAPCVVTLGVTLSPFHDALATLIGLPGGWRDAQFESLDRNLKVLGTREDYTFASVLARWGDAEEMDAAEWLKSAISWDRPRGGLLYLQAEGGKGKSTLLSHVVREQQIAQTGPLPLYVALRNVLRGAGVSWAQLVRTLGVVGQASENLRHAVRAGLVVPLLDGLDEVAGRYDPNLVMEVAGLLKHECASERAVIVLTGRTTEGALIGDAATARVRLELPPPESKEFEKYVRAVLRPICAELSVISERTPEAPWDGKLPEREPTAHDQDALSEWIRVCFDNYGRDRTLFFVQSLAAIGRSKQLQRNARLVVHSETKPPLVTRWEQCSIYEVAVLAAAFACVREQGKVDPIARDEFTPSKQLDLLSLLAVSALGPPGPGALAPNALTRAVFAIDPVNNAEVWLAILRQMQKHALLAATADSAAAGEWRPIFLSDWVRAALLVRAWRDAERLTTATKPAEIRAAIARAERGRHPFGSLFPGEVERATVMRDALLDCILREAASGSATACANYWWFRSGLLRCDAGAPASAPQRLVESMDLTEFVLEGDNLGPEFSGELVFLTGAQFRDCTLAGITLESCDLSDCTFERCTFRRVELRYCDGPIRFDGCAFEDCRFVGTNGNTTPVLQFSNCRFDASTRVVQDKEPGTSWRGEPVVAFEGSEVASAIRQPRGLLEGAFVGLTAAQVVPGLDLRGSARGDPAAQCLRMTLDTFFPRRAGAGTELQARPYIRSSAIGRGALPDGSPGVPDLFAILEAEGFTDGGRAGHLYAPWSPVGGVTEDGLLLRNEIIAFLRGRPPSRRIQNMIGRVRARGSWR